MSTYTIHLNSLYTLLALRFIVLFIAYQNTCSCKAIRSAIRDSWKMATTSGSTPAPGDSAATSSSCSGGGDTVSTQATDQEESSMGGKRPLCQYGSRCYRKNPTHLNEYAHPGGYANYRAHDTRALLIHVSLCKGPGLHLSCIEAWY